MLRKLLIPLAASTLSMVTLGAAHAQTEPASGHYHAATANAPNVDRVIEIRAGTHYVNVTGGETILFKVGNNSFARKFYPMVSHGDFPLSDIAPSDVSVQGIRVFCAPDLYERAG